MSGCKIEVSPLSHQLAGSPVIESEGWVLVLGIALGACRPFPVSSEPQDWVIDM